MAVALPVIYAFASGAVGTVMAGAALTAATAGAYLTVAGAVLSTLGAVTGKKDVSRVGALLSLGGGLANAFGGTSAAAGAAEEASSAWSAADSAVGSDAAQFNKYGGNFGTSTAPGIESAMEEAAKAGASEAASSASSFDYPDALSQAAGSDSGNSIFSRAGGVADRVSTLESQVPGNVPGMSDPLAEGARTLTRNDLDALTMKTQSEAAMPSLRLGNMGTPGGAPLAQVAPVQAPGSNGMSLFEQAKQGINSLGANVRQNKELYQMAGSMLQSMYGPQAEQADMERSIMARRLRNLNSPVALTFGVR